jgi:hypothetical protein
LRPLPSLPCHLCLDALMPCHLALPCHFLHHLAMPSLV